ncbi:MAG TPA: phage baseplate assembly protein V [Gemmatimonadaceae bacterium]|nr:phage baseplate assembly protein V [Gemmatimonadaceae bacterium]
MTAPATPRASAPSGTGATARHYGKYRGTVVDNDDPRRQGRVKVNVPEILADVDSGWALPCAPYAGDGSGAYAVPAVGAGVWVEFEAGDVSRPIWVGCWWQSEGLPKDETDAGATPHVKITRSEQGLLLALHDDTQTIALSDSSGANILKLEVQQGVVTLKATTKVVVEAPHIELVADSTHPGVFGDKLMSYLNQLVTLFNAHMHPGQMAGPIPVTPAPPTAPFSPPTPDLISTKVVLG